MEKHKGDEREDLGGDGGEETISPQVPSPTAEPEDDGLLSPRSDQAEADAAKGQEGHDEDREERRRQRKERHRQERERQRQKLREREAARKAAINYLEDPRKRLGRDYEQWQAGQTVHTPEARQKLTILRRIDDGHAGVVFKVRDDEGNILALKVPRKESEKQFKKLHQEVAKNARMQSLGLPVADITEEGGDYLVKRWIDGLRGDHWFIQWNEKGRPLDDVAWRRLCEMFDMLAAKNIYVQNLKDLNMIWDGQKWVVIDVGYFKVGLTPQQALGRYYETFDGRWNKPRYNRGRFMFLCPTIAALRGHSHPQHYIKREVTRDYYKKSKTSTGDNSAEAPIPVPGLGLSADGRKGTGNLGGGGGVGGNNNGPSEAQNDIKRKQAEAAMAVLERAKNRKKKKKKTAAGEGEAKDDTATLPSAGGGKDERSEDDKKKDEKSEAKNRKRSTKEEEMKDKKDKETALKAKKDKDTKDKKELKDKELKDKKEQREKDKKEKELQKKKK